MTRTKRILLFILTGIVVYSIIIATFGLLYQKTNSICYSGINAQTVTDFWDCFYFSLVSFQTIGYGDIFPALPVAKDLLFAESITSTLFVSVFSGFLVYFFFKRPDNVFSSDSCFIRFVNNKYWFSIRVGNKGDEVLDCKAVVEFLHVNQHHVRVADLKLINETSVLEKTWFVDFQLSDKKNERAFRKLQAISKQQETLLLRIVFSGTDKRSGSPVAFIHYYETVDLKFGGRYFDVHGWKKNKRINFKWDNFNKINFLSEEEINNFKTA